MLNPNENTTLICRLCLCKCENPRNMLVDTEFASKVIEVFPKIQISLENNLSNLVCDYCHNLILQFYGYFKTVNKNQDELKKMILDVPHKETTEVPLLEMEVEDDTELLETEKVDCFSYEQDLSLEPNHIHETSEMQHEAKENSNQRLIKTYTLQELLELSAKELMTLPLNFTSSLLCPFCPKLFKIKSLVQTHIFSEHLKDTPASQKLPKTDFYTRNLESKCDICHQRKLFKGNQAYYDHKFVHYDIKPYKCDICMFSTHTKEILGRHIRKHIYRLKCLGCLYCRKNFNSKHLQEQHIREAHEDKLYECELCGYKLMNKKSAIEHMKIHKKNAKLTFECERCKGGIRFPDAHVLELHRKQHILEDKSRKRLACHLCERKFHRDKALQLHLNYHAAGKIVACLECGKSETVFTNRKISKHARYHIQQKNIIHKCEKCHLVFRSRMLLICHKRSVHERNEQNCYKCGKMVVGYRMKRHLQQCNAGDLPCSHCKMVFKKESERRRHNQDEHVGIRCFRCKKQFQTPGLLALHQKYDPNHLKTKKTVNRKK